MIKYVSCIVLKVISRTLNWAAGIMVCSWVVGAILIGRTTLLEEIIDAQTPMSYSTAEAIGSFLLVYIFLYMPVYVKGIAPRINEYIANYRLARK